MITKITKAYIRTYSDSGQVTAYVEWVDSRNQTGRTEGKEDNPRMAALLKRAEREGIEVERQRW